MKKYITLLSLFLSSMIFSQQLEIIDGDYTYTKVIDINKSKNEIYSSLKKWLNNTTTKSKLVIDQDDPENGIVSFNETLPTMDYRYLQTVRISYKVNVEIKDKKIRYKINNIILNTNFPKLSMPDIKLPYSSLVKDIDNEQRKFDENKKLYDVETKSRLKKKHEYEMNDAKNNLRYLNEVDSTFKSQIIANEKFISDKLNKNDDW